MRRFRGVVLGIADAAVRLGDLCAERPLVLETGSRSCPIYRDGIVSTGSLEADAAEPGRLAICPTAKLCNIA